MLKAKMSPTLEGGEDKECCNQGCLKTLFKVVGVSFVIGAVTLVGTLIALIVILA